LSTSILAQHGNALEVHSEQGPAFGEKERAMAQAPSTLLYIEDNPSNLRLIERVLAAQRPLIKLLSANQGTSGIASALAHQPDLVLLDLQLPDLDGGEVLDRLQSDPHTSAIPVVMISADATGAQRDRIMALGARNYLTKPLDIRQLLLVIDELIGSTASAKPSPLSR
jgi:CheY-like chemotaxis protein